MPSKKRYLFMFRNWIYKGPVEVVKGINSFTGYETIFAKPPVTLRQEIDKIASTLATQGSVFSHIKIIRDKPHFKRSKRFYTRLLQSTVSALGYRVHIPEKPKPIQKKKAAPAPTESHADPFRSQPPEPLRPSEVPADAHYLGVSSMGSHHWRWRASGALYYTYYSIPVGVVTATTQGAQPNVPRNPTR